MEHRDEASSLRHSPKGEDDGVRLSLGGEWQSSFQRVACNDDGDSDTVGERSRTPSCSDQHPFRHPPPQRLFLPIPGRERIPCMQTFSSCVSSNERAKRWSNSSHENAVSNKSTMPTIGSHVKGSDHGIVKWKCTPSNTRSNCRLSHLNLARERLAGLLVLRMVEYPSRGRPPTRHPTCRLHRHDVVAHGYRGRWQLALPRR
jgi:hypothetical protein